LHRSSATASARGKGADEASRPLGRNQQRTLGREVLCMATSFQIRRAEAADRAGLWSLVERYQREAGVLLPDAAEEVFVPERGDLAWLVVGGGAEVGCAFLRPLEATAGVLELKRFYVLPDWRGRGIAWALLAAVIEGARAAGAPAIVLDTTEDMLAARSLYQRAGFREQPRYNENPQATRFMRLALCSAHDGGSAGPVSA
jgi:GNAT superfamily N-acetyltransferase